MPAGDLPRRRVTDPPRRESKTPHSAGTAAPHISLNSNGDTWCLTFGEAVREGQPPMRGTDDAAAAIGFGRRLDRARMQLLSWKPIVKDALRGLASVSLPCGLTILIGRDGAWANLPARPMLEAKGRHVRPPSETPQYVAIPQCKSKDLSSRFSDRLVAPILDKDPRALAVGAAA
jgi:hypothetical protein